ncbi:MAG: GNAT family N-acetyltransferase [Phycisphaerales bacterium]|nr:GNAT family N-acetyltransferase [Phycisphaerales bacterium]
MATTSRPYADKRDLDRVSQFLAETYAMLGRPHNWLIDRWVNLRYSNYAETDPARKPDWESEIRVWEEDEQLVGLVVREGTSGYALQAHPRFRQLEPEMLDWSERQHVDRRPPNKDSWPLQMEVYEWDAQRAELLTDRGYQCRHQIAQHRRRSLEQPIPSPPVPDGYQMRAMRCDLDEKRRYVDSLSAIFPHYGKLWITDYPSHSPEERRDIAVQSTCPRMHAPQYRPELDLCIEAQDGQLACVCTFWLDEVNRLSIIEPMGVHPDHRKRGLSRAIMLEGMRRSRDLGAQWADTTSYTEPAHRAYESVGLAPVESIAEWSKQF